MLCCFRSFFSSLVLFCKFFSSPLVCFLPPYPLLFNFGIGLDNLKNCSIVSNEKFFSKSINIQHFSLVLISFFFLLSIMFFFDLFHCKMYNVQCTMYNVQCTNLYAYTPFILKISMSINLNAIYLLLFYYFQHLKIIKHSTKNFLIFLQNHRL